MKVRKFFHLFFIIFSYSLFSDSAITLICESHLAAVPMPPTKSPRDDVMWRTREESGGTIFFSARSLNFTFSLKFLHHNIIKQSVKEKAESFQWIFHFGNILRWISKFFSFTYFFFPFSVGGGMVMFFPTEQWHVIERMQKF